MSESAQLQEILDRLRNRFYGKSRGTVVDVDASNMAVKATVPAVLGLTPTGWCLPCVPYAGPQVGFCMLPDLGANTQEASAVNGGTITFTSIATKSGQKWTGTLSNLVLVRGGVTTSTVDTGSFQATQP